MNRFVVMALALAGLGGLGWWAYTYNRTASSSAVEIGGAAGAAGPAKGAAGKDAGKDAGKGGGPRGPVGVEAVKAEQMALTDDISAVGNLRANETVVMKPEIAGRIVKVGFSDGSRVPKGAVLIELDGSVLAAQAEQSRAELGLAQTNFERTEDLAKRNFVSSSARDQAAANLKVQEARLALAEAQLAKTRIVAPFAGVLGLRNVSVGDFVKDGAELVTLEDVSSMKVDLRLPERFLGQLGKGQAIALTIDAFPGREFKAVLDALDAQVDANGRSVLARGRLPNADGRLRSGMFAKARLILKEKPTAVVVPEEAILPVGADSFVFRVDNGKAMRTKVQTGIRKGGKVEILDGVQPGDLIVTAGQLKLPRDAMEVRVIDPTRRPGGPGAAGKGAPTGEAGGAKGAPAGEGATGKGAPSGEAGKGAPPAGAAPAKDAAPAGKSSGS